MVSCKFTGEGGVTPSGPDRRCQARVASSCARTRSLLTIVPASNDIYLSPVRRCRRVIGAEAGSSSKLDRELQLWFAKTSQSKGGLSHTRRAGYAGPWSSMSFRLLGA
jgi:hypothetical protein